MRHAIDALRSKRRYRNINYAKLARLIECAELNVPESWAREPVDLSALLERGPGRQRKMTAARVPKKAWLALIPAGAAGAMFILFMTGVFDFMRAGRTGTAGIVSGDVVMIRGGIEGILHAGNTVASDDVVVTGANSSADIYFENLLRMRVLGGSRVAIRTLALDEGARAFDALVTGGGCVLDVSRLGAGESVSVHSPESVAVVRGTRFGVMVGADGGVRYEVFEGTVRVQRCLPPGGNAAPGTVQALDRYFSDHALDLKGGQACAIRPDRIPARAVTGETMKSVIVSRALPEPVRGLRVMRDDMERLLRSADGRGITYETGAGRDSRRVLFTEREAAQDRGGVSLLYIPVLDCIIKIGNRRLTAVRSEEVLWSVPLDGPVLTTPAYEATSLYFSTGRGMITTIDLFTGATQWKAAVPGSRYGNISLTLDAGGLYCASSSGTLAKFDRSGEMLWSIRTHEVISTRPVISDQLVFVPTGAGSLFGFDTSSGAKIVKVSIRGSIVSIAARKNAVFIATSAGRLYCYNHGDDTMLWEYQVHDAPVCDMSISGNSAYLFGRGGRIYRINADGNLVWDRDLGIPIVKRPSEDAASFYVPASDSLFVVDKITGDVTWSLVLPNITSNNVAVSKGHIFFETGKKRLSSLKK